MVLTTEDTSLKSVKYEVWLNKVNLVIYYFKNKYIQGLNC